MPTTDPEVRIKRTEVGRFPLYQVRLDGGTVPFNFTDQDDAFVFAQRHFKENPHPIERQPVVAPDSPTKPASSSRAHLMTERTKAILELLTETGATVLELHEALETKGIRTSPRDVTNSLNNLEHTGRYGVICDKTKRPNRWYRLSEGGQGEEAPSAT